jgi:hypothetical protein
MTFRRNPQTPGIAASEIRRRLTASLVAATGMLLTCVTAFACNVPVFRYALEHWSPDAYRAVIVHRGELAAEHQSLLASLQATHASTLKVRSVDAANPSPADELLVRQLAKGELPVIAVQYPARLENDEPFWQAPLESPSLDRLLDSPVRREVVKRLVSGQTAVWLMVESGNADKDRRAGATLEAELNNLPGQLTLPTRTDAPEDAIGDGPELRVEFSWLRIDPSKVEEQALVAMLLASEPDLRDLKEPLVFPVFGRLRSLFALVGPGITAENIRGSAKFLVGACSCQVKEQNPGFDLLLAADWPQLVPWAKSPAGSGDLAGARPRSAELVPIAGGTSVSSPPAPPSETNVPGAQRTVPAAAATTAPGEPIPAAEVRPFPLSIVAVIAAALVGIAVVLRRL